MAYVESNVIGVTVTGVAPPPPPEVSKLEKAVGATMIATVVLELGYAAYKKRGKR